MSISNIADIANIIIAFATLFLGYYIFIFQKNKDIKDKTAQEIKEHENKIETLQLQEQNIKLQWFKELIIQPHLSSVNGFYSSLHALEQRIKDNPLNEDKKQELSTSVKLELSYLRKTFVDVLTGINQKLYEDILKNLDELIDEITHAIFNDSLNLKDKSTYEKEIGTKITYSRNDLIKKIYNYKGI